MISLKHYHVQRNEQQVEILNECVWGGASLGEGGQADLSEWIRTLLQIDRRKVWRMSYLWGEGQRFGEGTEDAIRTLKGRSKRKASAQLRQGGDNIWRRLRWIASRFKCENKVMEARGVGRLAGIGDGRSASCRSINSPKQKLSYQWGEC